MTDICKDDIEKNCIGKEYTGDAIGRRKSCGKRLLAYASYDRSHTWRSHRLRALRLLITRCSSHIAPAYHALLIEHRARLSRIAHRPLGLLKRVVHRALRLLIADCSSRIALADRGLFIAHYAC
jgi:hypothetical protein